MGFNWIVCTILFFLIFRHNEIAQISVLSFTVVKKNYFNYTDTLGYYLESRNYEESTNWAYVPLYSQRFIYFLPSFGFNIFEL